MSSIGENHAIIAAAGSRKTQLVIESALAVPDGNVLITTYTNENRRQIIQRIEQEVGTVPSNITILGWFSFLIAHGIKPYQRALVGEPNYVRGLNFKGRRSRYTPRSDTIKYYFDSNGDLLRDGVSDFVVSLDEQTEGAVINRLESIYTHLFIDEAQDLVGYDLELLNLLFQSMLSIMLVGDPRQAILETNLGQKNKKYQGAGMIDWLAERADVCELGTVDESFRCNQAICDFGDAIFPELPRTKSRETSQTNHDGIFLISREDVHSYLEKHADVTILRRTKKSDTMGFPALNIGVAKGSTFDRVMIFPTRNMREYLEHGDPSQLNEPQRLYVAATRARFSVAFVDD